jgi:chromosome segregation ATPase
MLEIIPLLLSVGLFFLTLIIIFTLRSSDNKVKNLDHMRRNATQYMQEVKRYEDRLKELVIEVGTKIDKDKEDLETLFHEINNQRTFLIEHSQDLSRLSESLNHYNEVLLNLNKMTEKAEEKTKTVKEELSKTERIKGVIDDFNVTISITENRLKELTDQLNHMIEQQQIYLNRQSEESIAATKVEIDLLIETSINKIDQIFQNATKIISSYLQELATQTASVETLIENLEVKKEANLEQIASEVQKGSALLNEKNNVLTDLKEQRLLLQHEIATLENDKELLNSEFNQIKEEKEQYSNLLTEEQSSYELLKEQQETLLNELAQLGSEKEEYSSFLSKEQSSYELLKEQQEVLLNELSQLESEKEKLSATLQEEDEVLEEKDIEDEELELEEETENSSLFDRLTESKQELLSEDDDEEEIIDLDD